MRREHLKIIPDILIYGVLLAFAVSTIFPFYNIAMMSLNDSRDLLRAPIYFLPRKFTFSNYLIVFSHPMLMNAFFITVARTVLGVSLTIFNSAMVAFALRKKLKFRMFYLMVFTIPMFFSGGIIPVFINYRNLRLYDNFLVYIIPVVFSFFYCIIMMNYFNEIGSSLEESAKIDGAGYFRIFIKIFLPISLPVVAALTLFEGVNQWNAWFDTLYYTNSPKLLTLQALLVKIIVQSETAQLLSAARTHEEANAMNPEALKLSTMVIISIPIILIYPFMQNYFVKGLMIGSIKE